MFPCIGTHSASKGYHLAVYLLLLHFLKKKKGRGGRRCWVMRTQFSLMLNKLNLYRGIELDDPA